MKTLLYISQHRSWRALLLLLLFSFQFAAFNSLSAQVVEDGEAFYIYRNDGDFDGFFYDQVEEMRYSKVDVDGLESNDYVTYEVVTADSTFRIPLAAIDSISFVQPPIEFNPMVRHMDLLGMTEYITEVDGMTLTFSSSLPAELMPEIGHVLLGFTGPLEENGFGGRVANVIYAGDKIFVVCDKLEKLSDIFKRFISVEEVCADENGKPLYRRMAGYKTMLNSARRVYDGTNRTLVDANLTGRFKLLPDDLHVHLNMDLSLAIQIRLAMVYKIDSEDAYTKTMLMESVSLQAGLDIGVDGSAFKTIRAVPTFSIKFPVQLPLFEIRPVPEFGVRYGGDFSFKCKLPSFSRAFRQTFIMDLNKSESFRYEGNETESGAAETVSEFFSDMGASITFNGFVQPGIKISCAVYTNSWIEAIFEAGVGVDFFVGPKIEASIIGLSATVSDLGDGIYLFRNNKLTGTFLALDFEAFGESQLGSNPKFKYTFADGSFAILPKWEMSLFPTLNLRKAVYNNDARRIDAEMETNECMVFLSSKIGIGIMDVNKTDIILSNYLSELSFGSKVPFSMHTNFSAKDLKAGKYYVVPLIKFWGKEYPIRSLAKLVEVPPYVDVSQSKVDVDKEGGNISVQFQTNGSNVTVTAPYSWMEVEVPTPDAPSGSINIKVDKNEDVIRNDVYVYVSAYGDNGEEALDSIQICQPAAGTIQGAEFCIGYVDSNGEIGDVRTLKAFGVSVSGEGDILTVTGNATMDGSKYIGGENQPSIYEMVVSINLQVDLNPENTRIISGSITFRDRTKYDEEINYTYEDRYGEVACKKTTNVYYEENASASFKNVPLYDRNMNTPGYLHFRGDGGCITSLSGFGRDDYEYEDTWPINPKHEEEHKYRTFNVPGPDDNVGMWIDLIYDKNAYPF